MRTGWCNTRQTIARWSKNAAACSSPGGMAVFQVYNRISWLNALSQVTKVDLEHVDAPVLKKYSIGEFRELLRGVFTRPHRAGALSGEDTAARRPEGHALQHVLRRHCSMRMPRSLTRRFGWHLLAFCEV